jgi:hypothetical protein
MKTLKEIEWNYFWVTRLKAVVSELKQHFKHVEDVTYINDTAPCVCVDKQWIVYLPNSIREDDAKDESNKYHLVEDETMEYISTADTIEQVIDELINLIENKIN